MDITKKTTYCINTVFLEIHYKYSMYSINMAIVLIWGVTYILEDNYPRRIYAVRIWHKYPYLYIYYKPQITICIQYVQYKDWLHIKSYKCKPM